MIRFPDFSPQDPTARRDYTLNWETWLEPGERIVTASWVSPDPTNLIIGYDVYAPTISSDGKKLTVWIWGGTPGERYEVTVHVTTDHAPAREEDAILPVTVASL